MQNRNREQGGRQRGGSKDTGEGQELAAAAVRSILLTFYHLKEKGGGRRNAKQKERRGTDRGKPWTGTADQILKLILHALRQGKKGEQTSLTAEVKGTHEPPKNLRLASGPQ